VGEEVSRRALRVFDPKERYKAGEIIVHAEFGAARSRTSCVASLLVRFRSAA
jgi:hypothetical protein